MAQTIWLPRYQQKLYWERPNVSTTAGSTTWVTSTAYSLPGGLLSTNGDRLRIEMNITWTTAAADTKSLGIGVGYSSFSTATGAFTGGVTGVNSSATNVATISQQIEFWVTRLSATTASTHLVNLWEGNATQQSQVYAATGAVTWANANNILGAVGNTTGGNTEVITLNEIQVFLEPYGN